MEYIQKPWGYEKIWIKTPFYVGKLIHIIAGECLSKQYHEKKDETILILNGEMDLEIGSDKSNDKKVYELEKDSVFRITPFTIHRMIAITDVDLIEVSTPELDDVVRLEDKYGRAK